METKEKKEKALKPVKKVSRKSKVKKIKTQSVSFNLVEVILIILITGLVVSICSGVIVFKNYDSIREKTSNINTNEKTVKEFIDSYNHIMDSYINEVDGSELIDVAIEAMFKHLEDEYSDYLDENTTSDLQERLKGEYEGIGIEITVDELGNILLNRVFDNSPAKDAGLLPGDILLKVEGQEVTEKTTQEVAELIKTSPKQTVVIVYKRNDKEYTSEVKRTLVTIPSATSQILENNIGYIQIETFSATTFSQVKKEIEKLDKGNVTKLIIDVRGNSGGYLGTARNIAELFIDKGKTIYQLKYKDNRIEKVTDKTKLEKQYEILVLTNKGSASASEILAAALQESAGARIVGTQTYGKGTVQETDELDSGAMIKYTSAYWLTPKGNSINEIGIKPDIIVEKEADTDNQLEKALEILE